MLPMMTVPSAVEVRLSGYIFPPGMASSAGTVVLDVADVRWLKPQMYAATADTCSAVSCAPPMGGMGERYCLGCGTPAVIVFAIAG